MRLPVALTAGIAVEGRTLSSHAVGLVGESVHSAGVDPAVVEVEQRAHRDGEIDGIVVPSGGVERLHIFGIDTRRIVIDFVDETEQGFVFFIELGVLQIPQHTPHQFFVA